ncbi:MAG: carbohydrate porin, partial [Caulobacteraceae bacterium]
PQEWAVHGQTTFIEEANPGFRAPFQGPNSFQSNANGRETWDATLYLGFRPWKGAEVWIDPEIDQGFGLSDTLGIAGFPNADSGKVGASIPYAKLQRLFLRQTIDLGGARQKVDADLNQLAGEVSANRLVLTVGKLNVTDIFDANTYAHDPRNDFLNWTLVDAGTFDYAANAWGYTWGAAAELYEGRWAARAGLFDLSIAPNSVEIDPTFRQFQMVAELEEDHTLAGQPGAVRLTGYLSRGRMGSYADAIRVAEATGEPANIVAVRRYRSRPGLSLDIQQQVAKNLGAFVRAGWAGGQVEPYEYTDVDRTLSGGLSLSGRAWGRADDTFAIAGVVNDISAAHKAFLAAGGLGILVGDGRLPSAGPEKIVETYYSLGLVRGVHLTFDYQYVVNPAYDRERGPISVGALRAHGQF